MGYLSQRGKIGKYKGKDVYVVDLFDISEDMKHNADIFLAIVEPDRQKEAIMVWDGFIVGELNDYGEVHLYSKEKGKYIWPEKKKKKVEPVKKRKEEVKEIELEKLALNVSNGYGQFSKVVDGFFAGLEKLWQEIDVEIQGQDNF